MTTTSSADAHVFRVAAETLPIDVSRLAVYLESVGLPLDRSEPVQQFGTGMANVNYRLTAGNRRLVLRRATRCTARTVRSVPART